jgi:hypothetical protein
MLVMHKQALQLFSLVSRSRGERPRADLSAGRHQQPAGDPVPHRAAGTPPPPIVVPQVPQMNSPPPFALQNTRPGIVTQDTPPAPVLRRERRPSFSDRVARCLDDGAAWGMNPNQRAAYSRVCQSVGMAPKSGHRFAGKAMPKMRKRIYARAVRGH